uniref:Uncharacterized protein n=1 Tax=Avena sativa TaxID=4498 RepID=A0ACD5Y4L8_AVESA
MPVRSSPSPTFIGEEKNSIGAYQQSSTTTHSLTLSMAAGVIRLPPRLTTLAAFSSPTPNPFSPNRRVARPRPRIPPISISMDPALVDPVHLQALMLACAHSCAIRLSAPDAAARPEPVDIRKLRTAVAHSFLVVSVFCGARFLEEDDGGDDRRFLGLELDLGIGRQREQRLVGFGRAVSDVGLTASVHDIVVLLFSSCSYNCD